MIGSTRDSATQPWHMGLVCLF